MELTVVLTHYRRPENLQRIVSALATQTLPHRLFVWDNSPEQTLAVPQADWIVRSSVNVKCGARWWLAAHAETPWVVVMDDDLIPCDERVFAETVARLTFHQRAIGATGVVLDNLKPYHRCRHIGLGVRSIKIDTPVQIIKGRYFALSTAQSQSLSYLPADCEDDIIVSSKLGGGVIAASLQHRFLELPVGSEARQRRPEHRRAREKARRQFFGDT